MGATYSRVKNWIAENLTYTDLNAEIDNILTNHTPSGMDDYSATLSQMKLQTSPGAQGSESMATSLAGEIERIRYVINRITGETYWYDAPDLSLSQANTLLTLGNQIPSNRIVSGLIDANRKAMYLVPHGTNASATLTCSGTNLVTVIAGSTYTNSADTVTSGLTTAPSSNNTALLNDGTCAGQDWTKQLGEHESTITIDNVGTEISSRVGQWAGFKVGTEYFIGYIHSSTEIKYCRRGFFFSSASAALDRVALTDNDTITLMKLTYWFLDSSNAITVTYTQPYVQKDTPSGAAIGDFWFDLSTQTWKKHNGSSFVAANALFIGYTVQDSSGCKAARSEDFFFVPSAINSLDFERISNTVIKSIKPNAKLSVFGNLHSYSPQQRAAWDITADLRSGLVEASNTSYFAYVTDQGDTVLDVIPPYDRRDDLFGYYHPHCPWRCVGAITNDASSNFSSGDIWTNVDDKALIAESRKLRTVNVPAGYLSENGLSVRRNTQFRLYAQIGTNHGYDSTSTFNLPDARGMIDRPRVGKSSQTFATGDVDTGTEIITLTAHGINRSGFPCRFTSSGTLPAGLTTGTTYYVIYVSTNTIKVASSEANALAGTAINITDVGSGTHTFVQYADPDASSRTAMTTSGSTGDNIGAVQSGQNESHTHTDSGHTHTVALTDTGAGAGTISIFPGGGGGSIGSFTPTSSGAAAQSGTANITSSGGEARMKNMLVNSVIRT